VTAPEALGGLNLAFAEQLYELYLQDPNLVDPEWRAFFAPLQGGGRSRRTTFAPQSIFAAPAGNGGSAAETVPGESAEVVRQARAGALVDAYRASGHLAAQLDPLGRPRPGRPELRLDYHRLGQREADELVSIPDHMGGGQVRLGELLERLQRTYCREVGVQFSHVDDLQARDWLIERMESSQNETPLTADEKLRILTKLTEAEVLERFIQRKYLGAKSFSLEGGESLIPLLDLAIERAAEHGLEEVVIGMAHRGRLNVLVNTLHKKASDLLREFEDKDPELFWGRGDVKYHMGHQAEHETSAGKRVLLTLCFNPSHLEFVGPVVMGRVRARQDQRGDSERNKVLPLVIHGDAAFAGQGVVQEMLNLHELSGYETGGTVHVIVNNQIGFTTPPESSRSTHYATDVARLLQAPIFHVNGESPEAVAHVIRLAMDFRAHFGHDAVIDLYCYRKHGHNEGDEPAFTQPLMYAEIRGREKSVREAYLEHLLVPGGITPEQADQIAQRHDEHLESELAAAREAGFKRQRSRLTGRWDGFTGGPEAQGGELNTSVPRERLQALLLELTRVPDGFTPHPKIQRLLDARAGMARGERVLDWAAGEALAFATLLGEGHPVRLSGQDAGRGTFSHRHSVLHDVTNANRHIPLQHLDGDPAGFEVWDSPLTETAVLAFEYGYSLDAPRSLCLWEAQFGDFCNVAQVIFDQFITSAEDKWDLLCGLVTLLPHGFEGQGPEHSSARLERFLQMCAEDNIQVVNLTTPAQIFHCLRRQLLRAWRKPLIVMSPKSLLRRPDATSTLEDLSEGGFQRLIPDEGDPKKASRILLCSGKVYYDLADYRTKTGREDVAILRLEQLYPLPHPEIQEQLGRYGAGVPVYWVQEEPWNMGAWYYMRARLSGSAVQDRVIQCVSRQESASPATGSKASHVLEQQALIEKAFGDGAERV
jgi:2-oxoglutarate dehydrogenase E1 component